MPQSRVFRQLKSLKPPFCLVSFWGGFSGSVAQSVEHPTVNRAVASSDLVALRQPAA